MRELTLIAPKRITAHILLGILFHAFVFLAPVKALPEPELFSSPVTLEDKDSPLWTVSKQLNKVRVFRGRFLQEKNIKALSKPLLSEGRLVFSAEKGLYWGLTRPFLSQTLILPSGLYQRGVDGQLDSLSPNSETVVSSFTEAFLGVISGDFGELMKHFEIYFSGDLSAWAIGLSPRKRMGKKFISRLILKGGSLISEIEIYETSGDLTKILFKQLELEPRELSDEELRYFKE